MQEMTMVINQDRDSQAQRRSVDIVLSPEQLLEARLKLALQLQRSLDPTVLVETFFCSLQTLIPVDGLQVELNSPEMPAGYWLHGRKSLHSASYRLGNAGEQSGEIVFYRGRRFSAADLELLETLLIILMYPLHNASRHQAALRMTMVDALTGLGNRLALNHSLARDLRLARRYQNAFSLLMIDIDHFKSINDRFGHDCGDEVLITVASTLQNASRCSDGCYRFGGEEFTVLLPGTTAEGAMIIAERLRTLIANLVVEREGVSIEPTVSIGIASSEHTPSDDETELLRLADKALYLAKAAGRNCVRVATRSS